jgi:ABC-type bacteriocin/lantibiotic exporter with double-glycine peptidase domain
VRKTSLYSQALALLSNDERNKIRRLIAFAVLLSLMEVITLTAVFPVLQGALKGNLSVALSDKIPLPTTTGGWTIILLLVVFLFVIKNTAAVWLTNLQSTFANQLYLNFAQRLYQHFYHQNWTEHTQGNSAEAFRKIKNTAYDFTNFVLLSYLNLIADLFTCAIMASVVIWFDYRIVFILIGLSIPLLLSYYYFRKKVISRIDKSFRELTPESNVILSQGIDCYAEAKIYNKEDFFIRRFIDISTITTQQLSSLKAYTAIPSRLLETAGILCFAGVIIYARTFGISENNLILFIGLLTLALYRIVPSVNRILISLSQIQSYTYTIPELHENLQQPLTSDTSRAFTMAFPQKITLNNISFQYAQRSSEVLHGINVEISKGDFIMLEGPSGTGKTTLIHLLAGLIEPNEGNILVDGRVLTIDSLRGWQQHLGFVPQASIVIQGTLLENIAFGEELINYMRAELAIEHAGLKSFIDNLPARLKTHVGENGLTLSGGQRQRLVLARALYRNPAVLLLDEVTNQLDEETKAAILEMLKRMAAGGRTIIIATHDATVRAYANRIIRLEQGKLHESFSSING